MISLGLFVSLAAVVSTTRLGYESIYKYQGLVQTTVQKPAVYRSNFMIHANIHVQKHESGDLIFLDNVTYTLYTGKAHDTRVVTKLVDAPKEAQNIKLPFYIERSNGIDSIFTNKNDELWSVNMKKAIASLFELDFIKLNTENEKPYAFYSEEKTIYGKCKVFYSVVPTNGTHSVVQKHFTPSSCEDFKWEMFFNTGDLPQCEAKFEKPISVSIDRTYNILKDGSDLIINDVQSIGSISFNPFKGKGNSHFVFVKQLSYLDETRQIDDMQKVDKSLMIQHEIGEFLYGKHQSENRIPDLTLSRQKLDMKVLIPKIKNTLKDILKFPNDIHVTLTTPDVKQGQSVNNFLTYLRLLNIENLEHFSRDIQDKESWNVFLQVLPQVGTYASNIFILKLIKTNSIENKEALNLLLTMPFYTRTPNVELLSDFSEIYQLKFIHVDIKKTALLSFATIISKALKYYPEKQNKINVFIDYYINRLKKSTDYDEQMLFMSALHNIGGKKVNEFLELIIQNNQMNFSTTHNLRVGAMWATKQEYNKNLDLLNQIFWPIFTDTTEHLEVRSTALSILMSSPSVDQLFKLSWFMQTENDRDVHSLYYTTLKSLSLSTNPCLQLSSRQAREMLQFTRLPSSFTENTTSEQFDYFDSTYGFGAMFKLNRIGSLINNGFTSYYLQLSSQVANVKVNSYSAYIKIKATKKLQDEKFPSITLHDIYEIYMGQRKIPFSAEDVNMEVIILHFNKVIYSQYYEGATFNHLSNFYDLLKFVLNPYSKSLESFQQVVEGEAMIPNDMGVPTVFFIKMPEVNQFYFKINEGGINQDNKLGISGKINWTQWNHQIYGLNTYNPIADLWHGSRRLLSVDARFALAVDVKLSMKPNHLKVIFNAEEDPYYSNIGLQTHAQTQVFVFNQNDNNAMTNACPECKSVETVTKGDEYRKQYVIWEKDLEDTGMNYKLAIFDCERQLTPSSLQDIQNHISSTINKNWGDHLIFKYGLMARHMWAYWTASPVVGSCGIGFLVSPSIHYPPSHQEIDFTISSNSRNVPGHEYHLWSTYNLVHDNSIIRTWNFHLLINDDDDNNFESCEIDLTRKASNVNDYKICAKMTEHWLDQVFTREWKIKAGETTSNLCPTNKTSINILIKGEPFREQNEKSESSVINRPKCEERARSSGHSCSISETSLKHYEYNIKYENLSPGFIKYWTTVSDWVKVIYSDYFILSFDHEDVGANQMRIELNYPQENSGFNISIITNDYHYRYIRIPLRYWYWINVIQPVRTHRSSTSTLKFTSSCEINSNYVLNQENIQIPFILPERWSLYAADCLADGSCKWQIFAKKTLEKFPVGLRIVVANDTLDVIHRGGFQFFHNDKKLALLDVGYGSTAVFKFKVMKKSQNAIIHIPKVNLNVNFNGEHILVHLPHSNILTGHCGDIKSSKVPVIQSINMVNI